MFKQTAVNDNVHQLPRRQKWRQLKERSPGLLRCILEANPKWKEEEVPEKCVWPLACCLHLWALRGCIRSDWQRLHTL